MLVRAPRALKFAAAILCALGLSAWGAPVSPPDSIAARRVTEEGQNTISGRAYLIVPPFGHTMSCGHEGVWLIPATPDATAWAIRVFGNATAGYARRRTIEVLVADHAFETYSRHQECGETGTFRFDKVADGTYYLLAKVYWPVFFSRAGGALLRQVSVKDGESEAVELKKTLMESQ